MVENEHKATQFTIISVHWYERKKLGKKLLFLVDARASTLIHVFLSSWWGTRKCTLPLLDIPYTTYYPSMGGPHKFKLNEGGGRIICSYYKCNVVSAHSNVLQHAVFKASIRGKYSFSRQAPNHSECKMR